MNRKHTYFVPWNAGLASETPAACRRLARLITALGSEINSNIVQSHEGSIDREIWEFTTKLIEKVKADGWTVTATDRGFRVKEQKIAISRKKLAQELKELESTCHHYMITHDPESHYYHERVKALTRVLLDTNRHTFEQLAADYMNTYHK